MIHSLQGEIPIVNLEQAEAFKKVMHSGKTLEIAGYEYGIYAIEFHTARGYGTVHITPIFKSKVTT